MNFSKKNHNLVDQNENTVKKSQKHDANLQKNSTLYFQVGLILTLLATYGLLEMQFPVKNFVVENVRLEDPDQISVNYVPEPIKQPVREIVKPVRTKVLTTKLKPVSNDTPISDIIKDIVTEPQVTDAPVYNPKDIVEPVRPKTPDNILGVEFVPIYPGCENLSSNNERLNCMSNKLNKLVSRKFNSDIVADLGLSKDQRIYVNFKIDATGNITEIRARNPHSKLKKEAVKVAKKIPQMEPARQSDKNVEVMYTLPIMIKVKND